MLMLFVTTLPVATWKGLGISSYPTIFLNYCVSVELDEHSASTITSGDPDSMSESYVWGLLAGGFKLIMLILLAISLEVDIDNLFIFPNLPSLLILVYFLFNFDLILTFWQLSIKSLDGSIESINPLSLLHFMSYSSFCLYYGSSSSVYYNFLP